MLPHEGDRYQSIEYLMYLSHGGGAVQSASPSPPMKGAKTTPIVGIELIQNPMDIAHMGTERVHE